MHLTKNYTCTSTNRYALLFGFFVACMQAACRLASSIYQISDKRRRTSHYDLCRTLANPVLIATFLEIYIPSLSLQPPACHRSSAAVSAVSLAQTRELPPQFPLSPSQFLDVPTSQAVCFLNWYLHNGSIIMRS